MKILVLSLLRLGDALLAADALDAIRAKNPSAQIDLLVNKGVERVVSFLPAIHRVYAIDRELLQQGLVRSDRPIFESLDRLKSLVDRLNSEKYDTIINLTQTKFSGYIAAAVEANEKLGMVINHRGQASFGSPWFRYLNDVMGAGAQLGFHYSDIFKFGSVCDLELNFARATPAETKKGKEELEEWLRFHSFKGGPKILLQIFTSDAKKNWPSSSWIKALETIKLNLPDSQFIVLGAPNEKRRLEKFQSVAQANHIQIDLAAMSLEGVFSLLQVADVIVTGDTSIKHLANLTPTRIVEIAVGSADISRTGAYKNGSLLISSRESCAPCPHSSPCHRDHHACAAKIDAQAVGLAISKFIQKDWMSLKVLAREYSDTMRFTKASTDLGGFWLPVDLDTDIIEGQVASYFDRVAWRFLLNRQHEQILGAYGTESVRFKNWIETATDQSSIEERLLPNIDVIEKSTRERESRLERAISEMNHKIRFASEINSMDFIGDELAEELSQLESDLKLGHFLSENLKLRPDLGLYRVRRLQGSLSEALAQQKIKLKLLRTFRQIALEPI